MVTDDPAAGPRIERRDIRRWLLWVTAGLLLSWFAVQVGARLGSAAPPFVGSYALRAGPASLLAPVVAGTVLVLSHRGVVDRLPWSAVLAVGYLAAGCWAVALAVVDGGAGLSSGLAPLRAELSAVGGEPGGYLRAFTTTEGVPPAGVRGHPPGAGLLLAGLHQAGVTGPVTTGLVVVAIGALTVPLALQAVRGVCGDLPARRYLPVLALAPWAVWLAVSPDAVAAALAAAVLATGVYASDHRRTGPPAVLAGAAAGLLLGTASMFAYAAPWMGLCLGCLYFARRRAALNLVTGAGALVAVGTAQLAGFRWVDGLLAAQRDFADRVGPHRSALWWAAISAAALVLAAGPALAASLRKVRNTPAWPFLVGAGAAVLFTVLAGLARGGVEHAWLPFLPWLTVAAVAPERPGGPAPPAPLATAATGALAALLIQAVLSSPW